LRLAIIIVAILAPIAVDLMPIIMEAL